MFGNKKIMALEAKIKELDGRAVASDLLIIELAFMLTKPEINRIETFEKLMERTDILPETLAEIGHPDSDELNVSAVREQWSFLMKVLYQKQEEYELLRDVNG